MQHVATNECVLWQTSDRRRIWSIKLQTIDVDFVDGQLKNNSYAVEALLIRSVFAKWFQKKIICDRISVRNQFCTSFSAPPRQLFVFSRRIPVHLGLTKG